MDQSNQDLAGTQVPADYPGVTGQDLAVNDETGTSSGAGAVPEETGRGVGTTTGGMIRQGLGSLVSGAVGDIQAMVRGEVQLAKAELKEEAVAAGSGGAMIAAGGITGLFGVGFLLVAVTRLLGKVLPDWLAAAVVGLGLLGGAAALGVNGKDKLSATALVPQQTVQTLKQSTSWAKQRLGGART
ncbi:MAG: phage holin family protein [Chloroflexota bacterium]|nr:phage holin family protein [Chloroflexota bacterium]MDP9472558.1 phage holin family protein [Chloroflexota bacterium]